MSRALVLCLAVVVAVVVAGCDALGSRDREPTPIALSPLAEAVVAQSNAFGLSLFSQVAARDAGNLMLSPLSASAALTMLLNGTDGETYAQIHSLLGYADASDLGAINASYRSLRDQLLAADPEVTIALANAVFYDQAYGRIQPSFLDAMRDGFDATVQALPFADPAAVGVLNQWASDQTQGRVPQVIERIERDNVLYLLNALYVKGDWSVPFDPASTRPGGFALADGQTLEVPMMNGTVPALAAQGDGYQALELPYGRGNFSMVILMPDDASLADFARQLEAGLWRDATTRLDASGDPADLLVMLPRFEFSSDQMLNDPLQALGLSDAFVPGLADLSRMGDDRRLYVSMVKQNTFLKVDEEGSEAAAVTAVEVSAISLGPHVFVTRPFVFAIRERTTNTLLFLGQVANPAL